VVHPSCATTRVFEELSMTKTMIIVPTTLAFLGECPAHAQERDKPTTQARESGIGDIASFFGKDLAMSPIPSPRLDAGTFADARGGHLGFGDNKDYLRM
jgi:hypothetical protein